MAFTKSDCICTQYGETVGMLMADNAAGKVCGVFSSALYCTVADSVVVFHDKSYGYVPFGVALSDISAFLRMADAAVDFPVTFSRGLITIGEKRFEVENQECFPTASTAKFKVPRAERTDKVRAYVAEHGSKEGIIRCINDNLASARDSVEKLSASFADGEEEAAKNACRRLIGLGRGLTPSGDDFLCGFFSLLIAARKAKLCVPDIIIPCRDAVLQSLNRTSTISGAYLRSALNSEFFTVYDDAARAILTDEPLSALCDFVLRMGASSGTDTLCGAICAAEILQKLN